MDSDYRFGIFKLFLCKAPGGGARSPPKIGKKYDFLRKIVIFHTKYPKYFRTSLRSAQFF